MSSVQQPCGGCRRNSVPVTHRNDGEWMCEECLKLYPDPLPPEAQRGDLVRVTTDGWALKKGTEFIAHPFGADATGRSFIYEPRMEYCVPFGSYEIVRPFCCPECKSSVDTIRMVVPYGVGIRGMGPCKGPWHDATRWKYNWRQPTPHDQLTVILMAWEGWLINVEDGTTPPSELHGKLLPLMEQMRALKPYLTRLSW